MSNTTNDPEQKYGEREPMLSDAEMIRIAEASPQHPIVASVKKIDQIALAASYGGAFDARDRYERLISSGDLIRRDELVAWLEGRIHWSKGAHTALGEVNHNTGAAFGLQGEICAIQRVIDHINKKP